MKQERTAECRRATVLGAPSAVERKNTLSSAPYGCRPELLSGLGHGVVGQHVVRQAERSHVATVQHLSDAHEEHVAVFPDQMPEAFEVPTVPYYVTL